MQKGASLRFNGFRARDPKFGVNQETEGEVGWDFDDNDDPLWDIKLSRMEPFW